MKFYQFLMQEHQKKYFEKLNKKLDKYTTIFPTPENWMKPFALCDLYQAKVIVMGEAPSTDGTADGLSLPGREDLAKNGSLLVNCIFTSGEKGPHKNIGWEVFTDALVKVLDMSSTPKVFILCGKSAKKKSRLINKLHHKIIIVESHLDVFIKDYFKE